MMLECNTCGLSISQSCQLITANLPDFGGESIAGGGGNDLEDLGYGGNGDVSLSMMSTGLTQK